MSGERNTRTGVTLLSQAEGFVQLCQGQKSMLGEECKVRGLEDLG